MFKAGKLKGQQLPTGTILIDDEPCTSCKVVGAEKTFTIQVDVDLNDVGLSGKDQKDILDEMNRLADLIGEKLQVSVISKIWIP
jgi:hypothetical protein